MFEGDNRPAATMDPISLGQRVVAIRRAKVQDVLSLWAAIVLAGSVLGFAVFTLRGPDDPFFLFFFAGSCLCALLLALSGVALSKWGPVRAIVTARGRGLVFGLPDYRTRTIAADRIVSGAVMPLEQRLELTLDNGDVVELQAHGAQDGQAVAALLGVSAEQRCARFEEQRPLAKAVLGLAGALTLFPWLAAAKELTYRTRLDAVTLTFIVVVTALTVLGLRWAMNRPSLSVGVDGVTLQRRGKTRRWALPAIAHVDTDGDALVIIDRSGAEEHLPIGPSAAAAARDRLRELMVSTSELGPEPGGLLHELLIAGAYRRYELWARLCSSGMHRVAGWSADELISVVVDPRVSRRKRLGAAMVLGLAGADSDKLRARDASVRIGQPELRDAVSRALERQLLEQEIEELVAEEEAGAVSISR